MYIHYILKDSVGYAVCTDIYQIISPRHLSECHWIVPGTVSVDD